MVTVILCTHNPRWGYLQRCLDALRTQTLPDGWQLLLVDNCSDESIASHIDLSWHPAARILREEKLGLTPARLCGIRESKGELLVFVDDDNVLDPDFLEAALAVMKERFYLGSWSGQCRPEFEQHPQEWTRRYWGNLSIREFSRDAWSNLPRLAATMPYGAGLCVRRKVALRYVELHECGRRSLQFDRRGKSLLSGGDNDLAACACDLGLGVGIVSSLKLTHLIPPERLTLDYLTRLAEAIHYSSELLDWTYGAQIEEKAALGRLADFLRIARMKKPHRQILR